MGDLGLRYLYVGQFGVAWDNAFNLSLHQMGVRHYSPGIGRFLQPDPAGLELNPFSYAANRPITEIDPEGTYWYHYRMSNADLTWALQRRYVHYRQTPWGYAPKLDGCAAAALGAAALFWGADRIEMGLHWVHQYSAAYYAMPGWGGIATRVSFGAVKALVWGTYGVGYLLLFGFCSNTGGGGGGGSGSF
jgi:RHS repeat-associated protein